MVHIFSTSVRSLPGPGQYAIQRLATEAVVDKVAQSKTAPKPKFDFLVGEGSFEVFLFFLGVSF